MNQENEIEMKAAENKKPKKEINKKHNQLKKIDLETARTLEQIKDKVNKKTFGRKITLPPRRRRSCRGRAPAG